MAELHSLCLVHVDLQSSLIHVIRQFNESLLDIKSNLSKGNKIVSMQ